MRGARQPALHLLIVHGIIPAGAGSTTCCTSLCRRSWDHPRRCGEHRCRCRWTNRKGGSSPQVRGAPRGVGRRSVRRGIIPAGAGSTGDRRYDRRMYRDHPRRCGEHGALPHFRLTGRGSSPQVRGARCLIVRNGFPMRIIPAGAGSTPGRPSSCRRGWDHPRRCGEHDTETEKGSAPLGSSPQVRGAHVA